jgi:hypothetical protein
MSQAPPEWLAGEPESLILKAAQLDTFKKVNELLETLTEPTRARFQELFRIVNESAFIAGVLDERAAVIALSNGDDCGDGECTHEE